MCKTKKDLKMDPTVYSKTLLIQSRKGRKKESEGRRERFFFIVLRCTLIFKFEVHPKRILLNVWLHND